MWRRDCFKIFDVVDIGGARESPSRFWTSEEQLLVREPLRQSFQRRLRERADIEMKRDHIQITVQCQRIVYVHLHIAAKP